MGIRGLTTYIENHSDYYLKYYELCDTYLVIDGCNIYRKIYDTSENMNCKFGGDYDKYAQCVSNFFDDLKKCNVTPLVLFDGGKEDKNLKQNLQRYTQRFVIARNFSPMSERKFYPLLIRQIFKDVINEKNIQFVQCLFEADNAIASVAKMLNCPVLSCDSDFYIYGTQYIPFNTLHNYIIKNPIGQSYAKPCKIYRVEYLLNSFKGLNQSILPLAAVFLGQNIVKCNALENILHHLQSVTVIGNARNYSEYCIKVVFNWLKRFTLEEAIFEILSRTPISMRQRILNIIEDTVNSCTNISAEMLILLGFPENYNTQMATDSAKKIFKFNKDINSFPYIKETYKEENFQEYKGKETHIDKIVDLLKPANIAIIDNLPAWFVNEFHTDQNNKLEYYPLEGIYPISQFNLRETPLIARRQILDDALGIIDTECIDELLPEWKLYIITIKYWMEEQKTNKSIKNILYSIFLCMLFNIIDLKIGKHRSLLTFQRIYGEVIEAIQKRRKTNNYKAHCSVNVTITEAYNEICLDDCLLAAPFFISHFQISSIEKYDRSIIHAFAQFQTCLNLAINLNALLDYPYLHVKVANLYNGTLLYTLNSNFQTRKNVLEYINTVLKNSQSLLRLFNTLLLKIEPLFTLELNNNNIDE
ncbi:inactive serine protease scarface isoform X1 [Ptiloglossa arizonensis]|uniref:inactive serine protease scarface isoform X1 n=1 Tax=Ptiloglossa arizonensis TaxID=3350558 RepID=UPI003FA0D4C6